jgi:UDP-glucuronate 4-epimerase
MKTILVTGGAGFIGFHTCRSLLERGDAVICVDNLNKYYDPSLKYARLAILRKYANFQFYKVDIADRSAMSRIFRKRIDKICHLAAQAGVRYSIDYPLSYDHSNIMGTYTIFELAVKHKVKQVVAASSSSVYGSNRKIPFSVRDPVEHPISTYAATKRGNELMARYYSGRYGLNVTMLRFFTVYGPYGRPDMALFKFVRNTLLGKPIDVYNYGRMERDFTFVADIVAGILASLDRPQRYQVLNLGNSDSVKLNDFISSMEKSLGMKAKRNLMPMQKGDVPKTFADVSLTTRLLGWKPKVSVEDGVQRFVDWYIDYYGLKRGRMLP